MGSAILFIVSYSMLLRKVSLSTKSPQVMTNAFVSTLILISMSVRASIVFTNEGFSLQRFTFNGNRNYSTQSKLFLAIFSLGIFFANLAESSLAESKSSQNPRLYQIREALATRLSTLANRPIPIIIERIKGSQSFMRCVAIMPVVCFLLGIQMQVTPMDNENTYSINLAYNAKI